MKFSKTILALSITISLSACTTVQVDKSSKQIDADRHVANNIFNKSKQITKTQSNVEVVDEYFIASKPFSLSDKDLLPEVFNESYTHTKKKPLSLQEIITQMGYKIGAKTLVSSDAIDYIKKLESNSSSSAEQQSNSDNVNTFSVINNAGDGLVGSNIKFSLEFTNGSVKEFLDFVAAKTNLFWMWENNTIVFYRTETKTLPLDYIGGTNTFNADVVTGTSSGESNSESDGGSVSEGEQNTTMNYKPKDVWIDLEGALNKLKSEEGKFSISQEAGIVTITDTPRNLEKIEKFVKELNDVVSRQVAIRTEIYEISIEDTADKGSDIDAIFNSSSITAGISSAMGVDSNPNFSLGVIDESSPWKGSKGLISALETVANVSTITSALVYTTNGLPAPLQNLDTTSYLKNLEIETDDDTNSETASVEQGDVKSGFSLAFLPRITSRGDIALTFSGHLSQLTNMKVREFSGLTLESPEQTSKKFLQRLVVKSGKTIMVAGFERTENKKEVNSIAGESSWLPWQAGGNKKGGETRIMTLILLTPYSMSR